MFLAKLAAALIWAFVIKVIVVPLCGHRITWRLALLFALVAAFHN